MRVEALHASIIDALHAHIALVDAEGVISAVNEQWCRFACENAHDAAAVGVGVNYIAVCDRAAAKDDAARDIAEALRRVLAGDLDRYEREYPCHAPHEQRWFRVQIGGFVGDDGRRNAVLAHENITTLKLAEQRLIVRNAGVQAELDKARAELVRNTRLVTIGQVAASIAHELRNPLGAIRNAAYLIRRVARGTDQADGPKITRYLDIIESEVAGSDRIIADLMAMARGRPPERVTAPVAELVTEALSRIPGLPSGAVSVAYDPGPSAELFVDPGQFGQVIENLVANGLQACERVGHPPRVHVGVAATPAAAEVRIADAGDGIRPEFLERVFEPMFSTRVKGTGLGLSICRQVVRGHGGAIFVDAEPSELGGAAFVIRLPGREVPAPAAPAAPGPAEADIGADARSNGAAR